MKIKNIKGDDFFVKYIPKFHNELLQKVYNEFPHYKEIASLELDVSQTSKINSVGYADFTKSSIQINNQLTEKNPKLLYEVYGHELAHLLSTFLFKKNVQHGKEWVELMEAMGLPPRESLSITLQEKKSMNVLTVKCKCFTNNLHKINKSQFHNGLYCKKCHSSLKII